MKNTIELRGFARLMNLFQERGWPFPYHYPLSAPVSGCELLEQLAIDKDQVEAMFINGRAQPLDAVINPGDRVALIPPGTPGPYRILLGIRST
ncbi:MoaD/ThiS family protein [Sporolituus thermophilus]|uniref:ThiS family protein n=1 Tax=Sporolituus thermophilus DSM 23256 TaxID=1123285 RepID=A0A1G7LGY9_9FIRM|nr:MoaD/ThiS family protein [Sporolituus thermophilus]SDF48646.1 ThiS family protein [Sporolituus thermophilus DSM 23256]